jgi:hypothetical protein
MTTIKKPACNPFCFAMLFLGLMGIVLFSFKYFFLVQYEPHAIIQDRLNKAARQDPLLALQTLLAKLDMPTQRLYQLPLDMEIKISHDDVLVWIEDEILPTTTQRKKLLNWLKQGGRLILVSQALPEEDNIEDPLLNHFNIIQTAVGLDLDSLKNIKPVTFKWQATQETLQVAFNPEYILDSTRFPNKVIEGESGIHLISQVYGQGHVTVLSDLWFINNQHLAHYDHAHFFWTLLQQQNPPSKPHKVWLLYPLETLQHHSTDPYYKPQAQDTEEAFPPLFAWLWQQAPHLIMSLAILLGFTLWFIGQRFGMPLPSTSTARRRIVEHIAAASYFNWRSRQLNPNAAALLQTTRVTVHQHMLQQHVDWHDLPQTTQQTHLQAQIDLSDTALQQALWTKEWANTQAFQYSVQHLQNLKQQLNIKKT